MRGRLISLLIIAALSFSSAATYAKVSSAVATHQNLLDLIPDTLTGEAPGNGFCDLHPLDETSVGHALAPVSLSAGQQGQRNCVLPVPPRDVFEHIASAR